MGGFLFFSAAKNKLVVAFVTMKEQNQTQTIPLSEALKPSLWRGVGAIWERNRRVFRRYMFPSLIKNVGEPLLFIFAFGFGLGAVVDTVGGVPYLAFILPGMVVNAVFFTASFETSIGAFSRFHIQKTYNAILATPVSLNEIIWGEVLWASTKGVAAALIVYFVGLGVGALPSATDGIIGWLWLLPFAPCFAASGMLCTAYAKSYNSFSYFFTLWVTPSLLFGGVFFEISRFPEWVQGLAWLLPMSHAVALVRHVMLGGEMNFALLGHAGYILLLGFLLIYLAQRKLHKRLFD